MGRGGLRRGRGPDQRHHRDRRQHARHRLPPARGEPDHLARGGRQVPGHRGRRRGPPAARCHHRRARHRDRGRVRVRHQRLRPGGRPVREGTQGHRALRPGRQPELLSRRPELQRAAPGRRLPQRVAADPRHRRVHRQGRGVAALTEVSVITLADVPPVELAGGSWSRVLVADKTVGGNASALGYSVFKPGTSTAALSHSVEELAYIVSGSGVIRLETGDVPVTAGQALYVPARLWHMVLNPGAEDLVMVFSFPSPGYPPTERRDPASTERRDPASTERRDPASTERRDPASTERRDRKSTRLNSSHLVISYA